MPIKLILVKYFGTYFLSHINPNYIGQAFSKNKELIDYSKLHTNDNRVDFKTEREAIGFLKSSFKTVKCIKKDKNKEFICSE